MNPLFRITNPSKEGGAPTHPKVHYESVDARASLCSQVTVYRTLDGEKMRVWYRTKRPVTCRTCIKAVEVMARDQLTGLTGDQLEDILAHIDTFKNKYLAAKGENGAPVARAR